VLATLLEHILITLSALFLVLRFAFTCLDLLPHFFSALVLIFDKLFVACVVEFPKLLLNWLAGALFGLTLVHKLFDSAFVL
jgi:hypothetical protein